MSVGQTSKKARATFAVRQTALSPRKKEFSDVSIFQLDYSTGNVFGKFIDDNDYNIHIILIFHMSPNGLVSELISELIKES